MKLDYLVACIWSHHNVALMVGSFSLSKSYCRGDYVLVFLTPFEYPGLYFYIYLLCDIMFKVETAQETPSALFSDSNDIHVMPQQIPS